MNVMAAAPLEPTSGDDHRHLGIAADNGARALAIFQILQSHREQGASAKLVISAGVDPLRSVRCPRPAPAAVVVVVVIKEWRAYESKAIMAEKSTVSKSEPRKPGREPRMHKMCTREPAPAEVHAHCAEMRPSAHTTGMHAPSHATAAAGLYW
jgi:hypothetical protein